MNIEDHVRNAITGELRRQAEAGDGRLKVNFGDSTVIVIEGPVNLDELIMAVVGSLAGGP